MRATMIRRARHQERMEHLAEARAIAWLAFAVLCCLVLVVVGTLVVGMMLGGWAVPVQP
jgi:predicted DNA repair protein MutK